MLENCTRTSEFYVLAVLKFQNRPALEVALAHIVASCKRQDIDSAFVGVSPAIEALLETFVAVKPWEWKGLVESGMTNDSQSASRCGSEARLARQLNGSDEFDAQLSQCMTPVFVLDHRTKYTFVQLITIFVLACKSTEQNHSL